MKQAIRMSMKALRASLSEADIKAHSEAIIQQIEALPYFDDLLVIGSYMAFNNEIDLSALVHPDAVIVYPKVDGDHMHFIHPQTPDAFSRSPFGVMEPTKGVIMDDVIDLLLVPALAISSDCHRIGYGKGYYDRFLKTNRPKHVIGVIHDIQRIESIDSGPDDQRLDMVLTEKT
ncbi:MAG: 5-formyltetrahydrofolate cyclo-ligase [Acholeplasmataceae bacterium]|nr:5-formyltetrahydrofolate cyclo-ligase [Acholeplasmataceae bacterium]